MHSLQYGAYRSHPIIIAWDFPNGGFSRLGGYRFEGPNKKGYSILGSSIGVPLLGTSVRKMRIVFGGLLGLLLGPSKYSRLLSKYPPLQIP